MKPSEALVELKKIDGSCIQVWEIPLRLHREDAIAAELIEIAMERLGDEARAHQLLDVAASFFWWTQTLLSLENPKEEA